jgi:hypothetical protein
MVCRDTWFFVIQGEGVQLEGAQYQFTNNR